MLTSEESQQLFPPVLPAFVRFCKAFPPLMEDVVSLLLQYGRICASEASRRPLTVEGLTSSGSGSASSTFNRSPRHTTVGSWFISSENIHKNSYQHLISFFNFNYMLLHVIIHRKYQWKEFKNVQGNQKYATKGALYEGRPKQGRKELSGRLDWQCHLAGNSKRGGFISIFYILPNSLYLY